jgi:hypothetical protein
MINLHLALAFLAQSVVNTPSVNSGIQFACTSKSRSPNVAKYYYNLAWNGKKWIVSLEPIENSTWPHEKINKETLSIRKYYAVDKSRFLVGQVSFTTDKFEYQAGITSDFSGDIPINIESDLHIFPIRNGKIQASVQVVDAQCVIESGVMPNGNFVK